MPLVPAHTDAQVKQPRCKVTTFPSEEVEIRGAWLRVSCHTVTPLLDRPLTLLERMLLKREAFPEGLRLRGSHPREESCRGRHEGRRFSAASLRC